MTLEMFADSPNNSGHDSKVHQVRTNAAPELVGFAIKRVPWQEPGDVSKHYLPDFICEAEINGFLCF